MLRKNLLADLLKMKGLPITLAHILRSVSISALTSPETIPAPMDAPFPNRKAKSICHIYNGMLLHHIKYQNRGKIWQKF